MDICHSLLPYMNEQGMNPITILIEKLKRGIVDDPKYKDLAKHIKNGQKIDLRLCFQKHYLYIYVTDVFRTFLTLKIGYSADTENRNLPDEYHSNLILLYVLEVGGKWDETKLFNILKEEGCKKIKVTIDGIEKNELFIYDEKVIDLFLNYVPTNMVEQQTRRIEAQERTRRAEIKLETERTIERQKQLDLDILNAQNKQRELDLNILNAQNEQRKLDIDFINAQIKLEKLKRSNNKKQK